MQILVKLVQTAIFFAVFIGMISSGHQDAAHGAAPVGVAIIVAFIFTVIPWLIFMMGKQAITDFRRWRSKPDRVNARPLQLLNDGFPRSRITLNSRPRISK
jgi:hypothetical protein